MLLQISYGAKFRKFHHKSNSFSKVHLDNRSIVFLNSQLALEIHRANKRDGEHHNHRRKPHVRQVTVFTRHPRFNQQNANESHNGGNATHRMEHLDFFFVRELSVRAINKGH